jgi:hypothetical protein
VHGIDDVEHDVEVATGVPRALEHFVSRLCFDSRLAMVVISCLTGVATTMV